MKSKEWKAVSPIAPLTNVLDNKKAQFFKYERVCPKRVDDILTFLGNYPVSREYCAFS